MRALVKNAYLLIPLFLLVSCWSTEWTEKEREEFSQKCSQKTHFNVGAICFTGFEQDEVTIVKAIEKNGLKILDTILIDVNAIRRSDHDKEYLRYWGSSDIEFNVNHSYEFILGNEEPYVLNNMEMIMWAQYTMGGEGWGCEMGNFTIDEEQFEGIGNICITKRGYEFE